MACRFLVTFNYGLFKKKIGVMPSVGCDLGRRVCRVRRGDQQWVGLDPMSGAVAGLGLAFSVQMSPPAGGS